MAMYHVNPETGESGKCSAKDGKCPFGGEHFETELGARKAYEASMNPFSSPEAMKRMQEESLDEELQAWVEPGPLGNFLNHPLVQDMMVDAIPGLANMRLRDKRKRVNAAIARDDWNSYVFLHERPYRFQALEEALSEYDVAEPADLVTSVWIDSENIHQNYEGWSEVLATHGLAMEPEEQEVFDGLPEDVTIYRGCTKQGEDGFSWTLDKGKAEWFATRFSLGGAQLLEAKVPKDAILAYLGRRGESEIVVLPEDVVRESLRRTRL
jgi:hypothetical protein